MERKDKLDAAGAWSLTVFASVLALNQVVIKLTNTGISPVFGAGMRSVLSLVVLGIWCVIFGRKLTGLKEGFWAGLLMGAIFGIEFLFLFLALDMTTVSRTSIVFYSMPVWLALAAHFLLPGERLSGRRALGLFLAMAGVVWALSDPTSRGAGDWRGDILALFAALSWAGIALCVRLTKVSGLPAETQLFFQLSVSAVILVVAAPFFGPLLRDPTLWHWTGLAAQSIFVAALGFLFWLRLMAIYPASDIAAFSFLSPVLAVGFGWAILSEPVGPAFIGALALVAAGIFLVTAGKKRG